MRRIVTKFIAVEREMEEEHGPFVLFALFLPEDAPQDWDLVVSAPWEFEDKLDFLRYVTDKLKKHLSRDEYLKLSRIVPIPCNEPGLEAVYELAQVEHGTVELRDETFFGLEIKRAYVITSRRPDSAAPCESVEPVQDAAHS